MAASDVIPLFITQSQFIEIQKTVLCARSLIKESLLIAHPTVSKMANKTLSFISNAKLPDS
jgi:hypothetical protein